MKNAILTVNLMHGGCCTIIVSVILSGNIVDSNKRAVDS